VGAAIAVASAGSGGILGGVGGINVGPGRHGLKEACMRPCWTWSGSRCAAERAGRYGECQCRLEHFLIEVAGKSKVLSLLGNSNSNDLPVLQSGYQ
jgi:hypothetical protein